MDEPAMEESTETPAEESGESDTVMLSADMLGGIKAKNGDRITFCVKGNPDSEGNITGYFEADSGNMDQHKMDSKKWDEETIRNVTSPRVGEEQTQ